MGNESSSMYDGRRRRSSSRRRSPDKMAADASTTARVIGESISASFRNSSQSLDKENPAVLLIDSMCGGMTDVFFVDDEKRDNRRSRRRRHLSSHSEDDSFSEEDSRQFSDDDEETFDSYHHKKKKGGSEVTKTNIIAISEDNSSFISNDYTDMSHEDRRGKKNNDESTLGYPSEDDESTLPDERKSSKRGLKRDDNSGDIPSATNVPSLLSKPLASSFAKRCHFTKAGIGKTAQHYEGLTLTGNTVLMLSAAMKLKGCPTICDEDLRRVEQTYPNQFSRLPDELLLSSGWRRISKYCHFSNKPIPDGVPFFHSKQRIHPQGGYFFLLAAAVGMIRPIDVEPLTMDTLIVLQTDFPTQCDTAPEALIADPLMWILVDKFCFFSGGPINTEEDVYYKADFDGNEIYMLAFLSPSLTPEELYRLGLDGEVQDDLGLKSVAAVEEVESVYDLTDRDFDDLKLYHLGPCRALPPYILQPNSWTKVLPPHFINARQKALDRATEYEAVHGVSQPPVPLPYHHQQPQHMHGTEQPQQMMDPVGQPIPQTNAAPSNNADYTSTNEPNSTSGYVEFGQGQTTNNDPNMPSSAPMYWQQQGGEPHQPPQQQPAVDWNHPYQQQQQQEYYPQQQEYASQQFAPSQHNPADQPPPHPSIPNEQQPMQHQNPSNFSYYDPEAAARGGESVSGNNLPPLAPPASIPNGMNMTQSEAGSEPAADLVRQALQREVEEEGAIVSTIESGQPIDEAIATRAMQQVNLSIEESQQQQETLPPPDTPVERGKLPPRSPAPQKQPPSSEKEKRNEETNLKSSRLDPPVEDDLQQQDGNQTLSSPAPLPDAPVDEGSGGIDGTERSDVRIPMSPGGITLPQHSSQHEEKEENVTNQGGIFEDKVYSKTNDSNGIADQNGANSPETTQMEEDTLVKRKRKDKIIDSTMDESSTPSKNTSQQINHSEQDDISVDRYNNSSFCTDVHNGKDGGGGTQMNSPLTETTTGSGNDEIDRYHIHQEGAGSPLRVDTNRNDTSQQVDPEYSMEDEPFIPSPRTPSFDGASYDDDTGYINGNHRQHEESFDSYTDYGQPLHAVQYDQDKDGVNDSGYLTSPRHFQSPEGAGVGKVDQDYYDDKYYDDSPRNHADASGLSPTGYSDDYDSFSPSNGGAHYTYSEPQQERERKWDSGPYASNVNSSSPTSIQGSHTTSGRVESPSGFTEGSDRSNYSTSSAMRSAQELLKKSRGNRLALRASDQKQQEMPNSSPDVSIKSSEAHEEGRLPGYPNQETISSDMKEGESDCETSTEVTSVVSGSSVCSSGTNPDQVSRRAFILRMAKARMKSGDAASNSTESGGGASGKATAAMSASEKKFEESLEETKKSFESLHPGDSEED